MAVSSVMMSQRNLSPPGSPTPPTLAVSTPSTARVPELRPTPTQGTVFHHSSTPTLASMGFPGRLVLTRRPAEGQASAGSSWAGGGAPSSLLGCSQAPTPGPPLSSTQ